MGPPHDDRPIPLTTPPLTLPPDDPLRQILQAGVFAPSADNSQPWRFQIDVGTASVWVDPARAGSISDVDRALTHFACGAVIENMVIQAAALGYDTDVTLFPRPGEPDLVAQLAWSPGSRNWTDLARAIPLRHTNRRFYRWRERADPTALSSLQRAAGMQPGVVLEWLTAPARRRTALRLMRRAEAERFHHRSLHAELFGKVRFDVGWNRTVNEGLPPGALEVETAARPMFRALRGWRVMHALSLLGVHRALGWRSADLPARFASALGVLSVPSTSPGSTVAGARAFQRTWLEATVRGLAIQPFAAGTILPRQLGHPETPIAEKTLRSLGSLLATLTPGRVALILFRVGSAPAPRIRAARRDLESFAR